jgi:hypothetical protein
MPSPSTVSALVGLLQREADVVARLARHEERLAVAEEADEAHRDRVLAGEEEMRRGLLVHHRRGDGEEVVLRAQRVVEHEAEAVADGERVDELGAGEELALLARDAQSRGASRRPVVDDLDLRRLERAEEVGGEELAEAVLADGPAARIELGGARQVGVDERASKRSVDALLALVLDDEAHAAVAEPPVADVADGARAAHQVGGRLHAAGKGVRVAAAGGAREQDQRGGPAHHQKRTCAASSTPSLSSDFPDSSIRWVKSSVSRAGACGG